MYAYPTKYGTFPPVCLIMSLPQNSLILNCSSAVTHTHTHTHKARPMGIFLKILVNFRKESKIYTRGQNKGVRVEVIPKPQ
jgi:hypothetical protein